MNRPASTRSGRRKGLATVGALLALAVTATAGAPSLVPIRPGDTLWDLAREHGTSVSALRALNDLPGNGRIYAGRSLRVPSDSGAASSRGEAGHRVRSGETLSHIALRYGVSQRAIATRNGLSGGRVYAGRTLVVPGAGDSQSATASSGGSGESRVRPSVAQSRRLLADRDQPSKKQVRRMVAATARRHGVSPSLALAVAYHESGFQQRVVSGVNAIGVMQVLPSTGRVLGQQHGRTLDLIDAQDNITAGVLLLDQLLRSQGTTDRALAGYYQGVGSIARKGLLPQTHDYIDDIAALRSRFANG